MGIERLKVTEDWGKAVEGVHEYTDPERLSNIVEDMRQHGWRGTPVLVYYNGETYQALTGTHRIAAADVLDIEVEAVVLETGSSCSEEAMEIWRDLLDACDDQDRLELLRNLAEYEEISQDAVRLMAEEAGMPF